MVVSLWDLKNTQKEEEVLSKLQDGSDFEEIASRWINRMDYWWIFWMRQPLNTLESQNVIEEEVREMKIDFNFEEIESK